MVRENNSRVSGGATNFLPGRPTPLCCCCADGLSAAVQRFPISFHSSRVYVLFLDVCVCIIADVETTGDCAFTARGGAWRRTSR
jgi:hypothetical protein